MMRTINDVEIRLPLERWQHICHGHPEMKTMYNQVVETVAGPDFIQQGDSGEFLAVRLYPKTPLTRKWLVVAYREQDTEDGFVLTAYLTSRPSASRLILWKR